MSKNSKKHGADKATGGFIRKTVTIPVELEDFTVEQSGRPEHSGNLSSYVRKLIIQDKSQHEKQAA
jgi:hypothetical protein